MLSFAGIATNLGVPFQRYFGGANSVTWQHIGSVVPQNRNHAVTQGQMNITADIVTILPNGSMFVVPQPEYLSLADFGEHRLPIKKNLEGVPFIHRGAGALHPTSAKQSREEKAKTEDQPLNKSEPPRAPTYPTAPTNHETPLLSTPS